MGTSVQTFAQVTGILEERIWAFQLKNGGFFPHHRNAVILIQLKNMVHHYFLQML